MRLKMTKLDPDNRLMMKFGLTMASAFLVISSYLFFRQEYPGMVAGLAAASVFFITGLFRPAFLGPVHAAWMRLAFILGWVNTRIILILLYYLIFTPGGLVMQCFRMRSARRKEETYWRLKEKIECSRLNYERRF